MKSFNNQEEKQFPASELTPKEKTLLHAYQDREHLHRWDKIMESSDRKDRQNTRLKWILALLLTGALLFFLFGKNGNKTVSSLKSSEIAGLVDYPFMEQQVRGTELPAEDLDVWKASILLYKKGEFSTALGKSEALNHPFFTGMCLLHLKQYDAALDKFDIALKLPKPQAEIYYYKGIALQNLGRKEEAKAQFKLALDSRELREAWQVSARERIEF